jgi:hypothetical protein
VWPKSLVVRQRLEVDWLHAKYSEALGQESRDALAVWIAAVDALMPRSLYHVESST